MHESLSKRKIEIGEVIAEANMGMPSVSWIK